jgi:hypothetical protein
MDTTIPESVMERVRKGAALLDEKVPDWRERVSRANLDMTSTKDCILGQLFGTLGVGLAVLELGERYEYLAPSTEHPGYQHGFLYTYDADEQNIGAILTEAWRRVLAGE